MEDIKQLVFSGSALAVGLLVGIWIVSMVTGHSFGETLLQMSR